MFETSKLLNNELNSRDFNLFWKQVSSQRWGVIKKTAKYKLS